MFQVTWVLGNWEIQVRRKLGPAISSSKPEMESLSPGQGGFASSEFWVLDFFEWNGLGTVAWKRMAIFHPVTKVMCGMLLALTTMQKKKMKNKGMKWRKKEKRKERRKNVESSQPKSLCATTVISPLPSAWQHSVSRRSCEVTPLVQPPQVVFCSWFAPRAHCRFSIPSDHEPRLAVSVLHFTITDRYYSRSKNIIFHKYSPNYTTGTFLLVPSTCMTPNVTHTY